MYKADETAQMINHFLILLMTNGEKDYLLKNENNLYLK
jgi:hypothetical protein